MCMEDNGLFRITDTYGGDFSSYEAWWRPKYTVPSDSKGPYRMTLSDTGDLAVFDADSKQVTGGAADGQPTCCLLQGLSRRCPLPRTQA